MGIARRWVFPVIRILIFAAIAAALVKLAFFGGLTQASDRAVPTGEVTDPTTSLVKRNIANEVKLTATVLADDAVPLRSTVAGQVSKVLVATGQQVVATTPVAVVAATVTHADGTTTTKNVSLTAGAAGTVSALDLLPTQQLAVGDTLAQIAPPTFSVVGSLPAAQQYRLLSKPTTATVTISGGPEPFTCTGLTISAPLAGAGSLGTDASSTSSDGSAGSGDGTASTTTVRCAVPAGVTVFAGLAAKVAIPGGQADGVEALPVTAVEGTAGGSGTVYLPAAKAGGDPVATKVTLGLTDGNWVQVTGGLKPDDQVLQYVPGSDATAGSGG